MESREYRGKTKVHRVEASSKTADLISFHAEPESMAHNFEAVGGKTKNYVNYDIPSTWMMYKWKPSKDNKHDDANPLEQC